VRCESTAGTVSVSAPPAVDVATGDEWLRVVNVRLAGRAVPPSVLGGRRLEDGDRVDAPIVLSIP
jgi:hypothetical protein